MSNYPDKVQELVKVGFTPSVSGLVDGIAYE
jgi:hypothetical protein